MHMMWLRLIRAAPAALLAGLLVQPALAGPDGVSLEAGREYAAVRADLLKAGWQPVITKEVQADGTPINQSGYAGAMYRAGYIEVEYCTEGLVHCLFYYRRAKDCLQIVTEGEYVEYQGRRLPVLVRWSPDCHPPEPPPPRKKKQAP